MARLIEAPRSIIVACDVPSVKVKDLVRETCRVTGIGGYKLGFRVSGGENGLKRTVSGVFGLKELMSVTMESPKPIIYDHQKAGTDIPPLGKEYAQMLVDAGVDAAIIFPLSGPATQEEWTKACQEAGLTVIVGGHMTHPKFLVSEGGYIADDAPERIYRLAAEQGVRDFVVPGNKPEAVAGYRSLLDSLCGEGNFDLYAPGFVEQGGEITETGKVAGPRWHAIVGSAIYKAKDVTVAAQEMTSQILAKPTEEQKEGKR